MILHILVEVILAVAILAGIISGIIYNEINVHHQPLKKDRRKKRTTTQLDYVDGFITAEALEELDNMFK